LAWHALHWAFGNVVIASVTSSLHTALTCGNNSILSSFIDHIQLHMFPAKDLHFTSAETTSMRNGRLPPKACCLPLCRVLALFRLGFSTLTLPASSSASAYLRCWIPGPLHQLRQGGCHR
jgi:hypothetical protein